MDEKTPQYKKEDMERKFYNSAPLWVTIPAVILLVLLLAALIFPVFAQHKS